MEKIKELWENIGIQFVKFGLVGASNTVISLITYYIFVFLGLNYLVANFLGFITGTLNAYYWNSRFVFSLVVFVGAGDWDFPDDRSDY